MREYRVLIIAVAAVAAVSGTLGWFIGVKIASQPQQIIVHLDAATVSALKGTAP